MTVNQNNVLATCKALVYENVSFVLKCLYCPRCLEKIVFHCNLKRVRKY